MRNGCCTSRPTDSDSQEHGRASNPPVRRSSQAITSQTAINGGSHDTDPRIFAPPSGLSIHQSETSRSALSTPRQSVNNNRSRRINQLSLADHYNLPLQPPKPWTSKGRTWTRVQLQRERYEFFETRVTGRSEIWDGLKQVIECLQEGDLADAQGILDALSVTLPTGRLEEGAYDENGNLYRIPEAIISDPTDVLEDTADVDGQTVTGAGEVDAISAKFDAVEGGNMPPSREDSNGEKIKEAKGKAAVEKDAMKVKCRLSDRGGPDVIVLLGRSQRVGALAQRIRDEAEVPSKAKIRIAYLGKILDDKLTLSEQGWKEGHVINALIVGKWSG
ncbi:uncharacterized protein Z518_11078 [Rhinocladiella mackenziei CBS 650.93]|uniref:Ubiquitin-like domain-containing protein n=1 Tax=Rhinocladiella mackenziei CBS 650.93 TaxID=1442369 RepID=A0A0D2I8U6_9EURO|nr:uncharacterized protein Z518_11078 [Rhinocladiella mackenziei CBS 650.93]KIW99665.1 hypothetical protein Z518_11078 [Rhinocladiella mackenziei CBS 650.93]